MVSLAIVEQVSRLLTAEEIDLPSDQMFRKIGVSVPLVLSVILFTYEYGTPVNCILSISERAADTAYVNSLCRSSKWFAVGARFNATVPPKPIGYQSYNITWFLFYQAFGHAMIFWLFYQMPIDSYLRPFLMDARKIQQMGDEEVGGDEPVEQAGDEETNIHTLRVSWRQKRIVKVMKERLRVIKYSNILFCYYVKTLLSIFYQGLYVYYYTNYALSYIHKEVLCRPSSGPLSSSHIHCTVLTASLSTRFAYFGIFVAAAGVLSGLYSFAVIFQRSHNIPYNTYRKICEMVDRYNVKAVAHGDKRIDEMDFKAFVFNTRLSRIISRQILFAISLVQHNIDQCMFDYIYQTVFEYFSIQQFLANIGKVEENKPQYYSGKGKALHFDKDSLQLPESVSTDLQDKVLIPVHISKSASYSGEVCLAKALFGNPPIAETTHRFFSYFMQVGVRCVMGRFQVCLDDKYFKRIISYEIVDRAKKSELPLHKKERLWAQFSKHSHRLDLDDIKLAACLFNRRIVVVEKTGRQIFQVMHDFKCGDKVEEKGEEESVTPQGKEIIYLCYKKGSYSLYTQEDQVEEGVQINSGHVVAMDIIDDCEGDKDHLVL